MKKILLSLLLFLTSFSVLACVTEPGNDEDGITVTFIDYDDTVLHIIDVERASDFRLPENPSREGYMFSGWEGSSFTDFSEDITVKATYILFETYTELHEMVDQVKNSTNMTLTVKEFINDVLNREMVHKLSGDTIHSTLKYSSGSNDFLYTTIVDGDYMGFEYNRIDNCWRPVNLETENNYNLIKNDLLQYKFVASNFNMTWFDLSESNRYTLKTNQYNNLKNVNPSFGNFSAYQYTLHEDKLEVVLRLLQPGTGNVEYQLTYDTFGDTEASQDVSNTCPVN